MSFSKFLLAVSAAALLAGRAFADGGPIPEPAAPPPPAPVPEEQPAPPPPPSAYDWTGFYAGVQVGYAFGTATHRFDNGAPSDDSSPDGFLGGVHVGYQVQGGSWVYGVEGDFDYTDVDGDFTNSSGITSTGSTDVNYQGTLRFRLGHAVERILLFGTAGAAFADVDYAGGPVFSPLCCGFSRTTFGWTAGGGGEYAFTDAISGRLEYRYTDYDPENGSLPPTFPGVRMKVDMSFHTVYAGLSYHF